MQVLLSDITPDFYICDLTQKNGGVLHWETSPKAAYSLIVRGDYGVRPSLDEDAVGEIAREARRIMTGAEYTLSNGMILTLRQNESFSIAYTMPVVPAVYAVFSANCDRQADALTIYQPMFADSSFYVLVSANIEWRAEPVKQPTGLKKLLNRNEPPSFILTLLSRPDRYADGSVYYTFDGCEALHFPVTRAMFGQPLRIAAYKDAKPKVCPNGPGFKVMEV